MFGREHKTIFLKKLVWVWTTDLNGHINTQEKKTIQRSSRLPHPPQGTKCKGQGMKQFQWAGPSHRFRQARIRTHSQYFRGENSIECCSVGFAHWSLGEQNHLQWQPQSGRAIVLGLPSLLIWRAEHWAKEDYSWICLRFNLYLVRFWTYLGPITTFFLPIFYISNENAYPCLTYYCILEAYNLFWFMGSQWKGILPQDALYMESQSYLI